MANEIGRPNTFTEEVVKKLEEAFAIDATVEEACFYAGISRQTYYNNVEEGSNLFDRFKALRNRPVLKARQTIVKALDTPQYALEYLRRKRKSEFSDRTEQTGADGAPIVIEISKEVADKNKLNDTNASPSNNS